jgi:hypothetical protein
MPAAARAGSSRAAKRTHLPRMPTTRIYFDVKEPARYYAAAVRELRPVSYLMGELLDSSDEIHISAAAYRARVRSYLGAFASEIDLWEIGNEVNGSWTGRYPVVSAKLTEAYRLASLRFPRLPSSIAAGASNGEVTFPGPDRRGSRAG